jgi:hypothetical protein
MTYTEAELKAKTVKVRRPGSAAAAECAHNDSSRRLQVALEMRCGV